MGEEQLYEQLLLKIFHIYKEIRFLKKEYKKNKYKNGEFNFISTILPYSAHDLNFIVERIFVFDINLNLNLNYLEYQIELNKKECYTNFFNFIDYMFKENKTLKENFL